MKYKVVQNSPSWMFGPTKTTSARTGAPGPAAEETQISSSSWLIQQSLLCPSVARPGKRHFSLGNQVSEHLVWHSSDLASSVCCWGGQPALGCTGVFSCVTREHRSLLGFGLNLRSIKDARGPVYPYYHLLNPELGTEVPMLMPAVLHQHLQQMKRKGGDCGKDKKLLCGSANTSVTEPRWAAELCYGLKKHERRVLENFLLFPT